MKPQTIVYTTSMDQSVAWYSAVLDVEPAYRSDVWTSFDMGFAHVALHRAEPLPSGSRVELSLVTTEPLEQLVARLGESSIEIARGIQDETFGRSILIRDPEGLLIQVNEHE